MKYQFSINFNSTKSDLSPSEGLSWDVLSKLVSDLAKATDPEDGSKFSLFNVTNHGYTPTFVTASEVRYQNFVDVHKHIIDRGIEDLTTNEAKYAQSLKRLLKDGIYLQPLDAQNKLITTIYPSQIKQKVQGYLSTATVYGVITEMGSPSLQKGTHIYLNGLDYKIFTTAEQDAVLRPYYRGQKLALNIKQKRSLSSDKVINGSLVSFKPMGNLSLIESLSSLNKEDLGFLNGINNQDDILRFLGK